MFMPKHVLIPCLNLKFDEKYHAIGISCAEMKISRWMCPCHTDLVRDCSLLHYCENLDLAVNDQNQCLKLLMVFLDLGLAWLVRSGMTGK